MYYTERLEYLRECKEWTLEETASFIGLKREQYRRYEKGINEMPIKYLLKIVKLYKVSTDYLLGLTDDPKGSWLQNRSR